MRDLIVFAIVLGLLPTSFRRPFFGMLLFSWLAYMRPQDLCWGFARPLRFSFFVGIAMVLGWWVNERGRRIFAVRDVRTVSMVVLVVLVSISFAFARSHGEYEVRYYFEFLKIMVVALFTTGQIDTRARLRWMVWTIAACLAFYGVKGGLIGALHGGQTILRGPGGMLEDNNDFALGMVMNVPLLWYLGSIDSHLPLVRRGTLIAVVLTVLTVLLTHSRGAFLALAVQAVWIAWRSGRLVQAMLSLSLCVGAFFAFAPQHVIDRLATIQKGTAESSAGARIYAWKTALRMIEDNPVLGVGMRNFTSRFLDYAEAPEGAGSTYVAHNSYLQIWAESGSLAFACYLLLIGSAFVACRRVFRMSKARPDMAWAGDYARMMETTTIGFVVGATFLNRGHFDLVYHWMAMVSCLYGIASREYMRGPTVGAASVGVGQGSPRVTVHRRPALAVSGRWGRAR